VPTRSPLADRFQAWSSTTSTTAVLLQNVGVGLGYVFLAELVLVPRFVGGSTATPVWPAVGLALVAVWLLGPRVLPGIAIAAAVVVGLRFTPLLALVGALAPVAGTQVAVRLLRRLKFDDRLERLRDPLVLALVAAPVGAVAAATIGAGAAWAFGTLATPDLPWGWMLWLMRDWLGVAMFAPLAFAWLGARRVPDTSSHIVEGIGLLLGLLGVALLAVGWPGVPVPDAVVALLTLPFVAWAGLRFGARGASAVAALVTAAAIALAVFDLGPLQGLSIEVSQTVTFVFLLLASTTGHLLAAMKAERDDVLQKRAQLEEQLRHAQKMEAVGRLAGGIAHDFNNLLTAIIGYADIVRESLDPQDPRRADAEEIERAAMRAADLTRQMLVFSRRETARAKVLNLNTTLAKVEPLLRRVIGEDIQLTVSPKAEYPFVHVDAGQMEQVVMNLAVNARDAMPKGGRLTVETVDVMVDEATATEFGVHAGAFVALTVSDTGIGMSPVVRARIFEPYFTTKEAGKGTGLGLSTAYGIVRQAEGHVAVSSEVGLGTTFRVLLPRAAEVPAAEPDTAGQKLPGGTEHVLLVEDDASVRRLAKELLTRLGYTVTEAASGRAGLALGTDDTRHFDIAVCDVILGDMSGTAMAEALQALRPATRVLYISGYTDDAIVRTGVLDEGKPFLPKPFTPLDLARKIREVLQDREAGVA
jgi:signal transduction histidine kinase/ActR/RegA family two-component response regulator